MAAHSSILARKIPWTGESDELQSMGSQRVVHDLAYGILLGTLIILYLLYLEEVFWIKNQET